MNNGPFKNKAVGLGQRPRPLNNRYTEQELMHYARYTEQELTLYNCYNLLL
jgi:hypothetical protein